MTCEGVEMTRRFVIPVEIEELDDGWFLAVCSAIQGCHAEAATVAEAIEELQDVARVLLELQVEDGIALPEHLAQPADARVRLRAEVPVTLE
jgi:predicted RNase H-like HicB family nuclease